jgi:hypothetical protein
MSGALASSGGLLLRLLAAWVVPCVFMNSIYETLMESSCVVGMDMGRGFRNWRDTGDVSPVRAPQSRTAVKAKASAPPPRRPTTRAALTRPALGAAGPHREGTRSRGCGRQLGAPARQHRGRPWTGAGGGWGPSWRLHRTGEARSVSARRNGGAAGDLSRPQAGEQPDSVSVPRPPVDQDAEIQPRLRGTNTLPSRRTRVEPQDDVRVLRSPGQQVANPLGFSRTTLSRVRLAVKIPS